MIRLFTLPPATVVAAASALAAATGQATMNAVAFQPLPADRTISVAVLDNSTENLTIKAELEAQLRKLGWHVVAQAAPLRLTIDTGDSSSGAWTTPPTTSRIEPMDDRGRLYRQGEFGINRLAGYPLPGTTVVTPPQYRLGVSLDSTTTGARLWQGWTFAALSQGDPPDLAAAMVPKLAAGIGSTVREETFSLE